jgi:hypothetical protein
MEVGRAFHLPAVIAVIVMKVDWPWWSRPKK